MAYQQKEGQGSLFVNDKLSKSQPDYKGTILIDGKLYDLAAWRTTARTGREYISLKAEPHSEGSKYPPREQEPPRSVVKTIPENAPVPQDNMYRDEDYFRPEDPNDPDLPF